MIIECPACRARFRLDDSKIKGKGARVKCRKCGGSIIVLKETSPAPTVEHGPGHTATQAGASGGTLIPFPGAGRAPASSPFEPAVAQGEPILPAEAEPPAHPPVPEKDEVDLAFERLLSGEPDTSFPPPEGTGEGVPSSAGSAAIPGPDAPSVTEAAYPMGTPSATEAPAAPETPSEPDTGFASIDFGAEGAPDLSALEATPAASEPVAREEFPGEGGFLIGDSDTLDFLKEETPEKPSVVPADISQALSFTPTMGDGLRIGTLETSPEPVPTAQEAVSEEQPGASIEGNATPAPEPAYEPSPKQVQEPPRPSRREPAPPEPVPSRSAAGPLAAALLAVLVAAGGYFGFTASGRKTIEGIFPGAAALWGGKGSGAAGAKYDLRNVIGYYESGAASPRILVIKGQVANLSDSEKSGMRILASLLDNTDKVLAQSSVYAGNIVPGETIRKANRETLQKALGNRFGEGLSNLHVGPGKSIPFMVVFLDAPENFDSYRLEVRDAD